MSTHTSDAERPSGGPTDRDPTDQGQAPPAAKGRTPVVIRLLVLATFTVILNETIMVNAIPRLMADMNVSEQSAQWVSTAFMLTMAAVIPATGWFLQRVTTRRAYATAMGVFLAGTALAAVAPIFPVLLAGRVVQAAGTAVMMPLLMTTLLKVVPPSDRGRVMGNVTLAMSVAPALGPTVSGIVLGFGSWRLLFLLVLPIAGAVTFFGLRRLENVGETTVSTIDWFSLVIAAGGFGSLVYGLSTFGKAGIALPIGFAALGAALIAIFAARQLRLQRTGTPLMDLRALRHGVFARSLILMSVAFLAMLGSMILLPLYLQNLRGMTALQSGLLVMPGGIAMGLLGPTVGRLFDRFGGRVLVIPGSIGIVAALAGFAQVSLTMPYWQLLGLHMLLMLSLACTFTPVFSLGLGTLPSQLYSHGSSILGTLQQVAAAFGTALMVTVMAARAGQLASTGADPVQAQLGGMQLSFSVGAVLALLVVVMALLLPARPRNPEPPDHDRSDGDGAPSDRAGAPFDEQAPVSGSARPGTDSDIRRSGEATPVH